MLDLPAWWTFGGAAAPGVLTGAWTAWKWYSERHDRRRDTTDAQTLRERADAIENAKRVEAAQAAWFDRQERRAKDMDTRIEELEKDRDRGWDLARAWNAKAYDLRYIFRLALQTANGRLEQAALTPVAVPDVAMPALEDIPH